MDSTTTPRVEVRQHAPEALSIRSRRGRKRLITRRAEQAGTVLATFDVEDVLDAPNRYTVQIGRDAHAYVGYLAAANHSCDPTIVVDTVNRTMTARRDLAKDEELSFFYPSTEWDMAAPFACRCRASNCIRVVTGARHAPISALERHFLNDHIRALLGDAIAETRLHLPA